MTAIAEVEPRTAVAGTAPRSVVLQQPATDSITSLLHRAVELGTPVDQLEKLVALHERMEARQAQKDFAAALALFQAECPSIKKGSNAKITTKAGGSYGYTYAELDDIARVVNPILARHGLSYSWDSTVDRDTLTCVCTLRHAHGHSVPSSFTLPTTTDSAMSAQQRVAAAATFARRQTLVQALGLTTTDDDLDGADVGARQDAPKISEDQVLLLEDLLAETKSDRAKYLRYLKVTALADIRVDAYDAARKALENKRSAA